MSYAVEKIAAGQSELAEPFASLLKGGEEAFFALCEQVRAGFGEVDLAIVYDEKNPQKVFVVPTTNFNPDPTNQIIQDKEVISND